MTMPKLLFFDIDGTLFDDSRLLPPSVIPALQAARAAGNLIFLNSGRTLCNLDPRLAQLPLDGMVLGCGTRVILRGETLRAVEYTPEETARLLGAARRCGLPLVWECDTAIYFDPAGPAHPAITGFRQYALDVGIARDIRADDPEFRAVKMFGFGEETQVRALMDAFRAQGFPYAYIDRQPGGWEIVPEGCSKGRGIDLVRERLGVPLADCYAFGDSLNDLSMLTHVPHGVAMGNAPEALQRRCAHVAPRPEEDGIARALASLGLTGGHA